MISIQFEDVACHGKKLSLRKRVESVSQHKSNRQQLNLNYSILKSCSTLYPGLPPSRDGDGDGDGNDGGENAADDDDDGPGSINYC